MVVKTFGLTLIIFVIEVIYSHLTDKIDTFVSALENLLSIKQGYNHYDLGNANIDISHNKLQVRSVSDNLNLLA